eukprot:gene27351-34059_t
MEGDHEKPTKPSTIKTKYKNLMQSKQSNGGKKSRIAPDGAVTEFDPIAEEHSIDSESPEHKKMVRLESIMSVGSESVSAQTNYSLQGQYISKKLTISTTASSRNAVDLHVESLENENGSSKDDQDKITPSRKNSDYK